MTPAPVAEPRGGGTQVDPASEHLGGVVVPHALNGRIDASGGGGDVAEPVADGAGDPRQLAEAVGAALQRAPCGVPEGCLAYELQR